VMLALWVNGCSLFSCAVARLLSQNTPHQLGRRVALRIDPKESRRDVDGERGRIFFKLCRSPRATEGSDLSGRLSEMSNAMPRDGRPFLATPPMPGGLVI